MNSRRLKKKKTKIVKITFEKVSKISNSNDREARITQPGSKTNKREWEIPSTEK